MKNLLLFAGLLLLLNACSSPAPQPPKQLTSITIPMPSLWAPLFAAASISTLTDTLQFPERGTVTISAEILHQGPDTSFVHSVTVTQQEAANGVVFTASVINEPSNASQPGTIATQTSGFVFSEKTNAVKFQMSSRGFVVHSRQGILKK